MAAWLSAAEISEGPIFRPVNHHDQVQPGRLSDQSVALVVKRAGERAGLDPSRLAGHSLRRGFATTAARRGVAEPTFMRHTWHRSRITLDSYIEEGTEFTDSAASYVGRKWDQALSGSARQLVGGPPCLADAIALVAIGETLTGAEATDRAEVANPSTPPGSPRGRS